MAHNPQKLEVVRRAFALALTVHRLADEYTAAMARVSPGMRAQLLRAVDSIALNLTEGTGHDSPANAATLCTTAIASCNDVELQLRLASALEVIPSTKDYIVDEVIAVRRLIYGFRKYVTSRPSTSPTPGQR
jgi:four helix bundle protein